MNSFCKKIVIYKDGYERENFKNLIMLFSFENLIYTFILMCMKYGNSSFFWNKEEFISCEFQQVNLFFDLVFLSKRY
jgi:hypothetical protein